MKYISQLNAFGDLQIYDASVRVSDKAFRLYCALLHITNKLHQWEDTLITDQILRQMMQTNSPTTLNRARKELKCKGFISYKLGRKGAPSRYTIIPLSHDIIDEAAQDLQGR